LDFIGDTKLLSCRGYNDSHVLGGDARLVTKYFPAAFIKNGSHILNWGRGWQKDHFQISCFEKSNMEYTFPGVYEGGHVVQV